MRCCMVWSCRSRQGESSRLTGGPVCGGTVCGGTVCGVLMCGVPVCGGMVCGGTVCGSLVTVCVCVRPSLQIWCEKKK